MRTPTASELLNVWEHALDAPSVMRGMWLLQLAEEDGDGRAWGDLSLGERDAKLLQLHARLFGRSLEGVATCPACQSRVEVTLDSRQLQLSSPEDEAVGGVLELHSRERDMLIRFRRVNCADLIVMQQCGDIPDARRLLMDRCVIEIGGRDAVEITRLPANVQAELASAMAAADPQADLQLDCVCPECTHGWQPLFDIAAFLWQALHAWALRLLRDVDTLARVYHWSESDILAMSPRRRQAYLEQCAS